MRLLKRPHDEPTELGWLPPPDAEAERVDAPEPLLGFPEPALEAPTAATPGPDGLDVEVAPSPGPGPGDVGPGRWGRPKLLLLILAGVALLVAAIVALVVLLRPMPDFVVSSLEVPQVALSGETVMVDLTVTNEGGAAGEHELTIVVDGVPARTEMVRAEAGASESLGVPLTGLAPGTHEIGLGDDPETVSLVWVIEPLQARFPAVIGADGTADIEVTLANIGPARVSQELVLLVDGSPAGSERVALAAGEDVTVTFSASGLAAGTPELELELAEWSDTIGTIWVVEPPRVTFPDVLETDEPLVGGAAPIAGFEVTVEFTNEGSTTVENNVTLTLSPGIWTRTEPIEIDPGTSTTITYDTDWLRAGTYDLTVTLGDLQYEVGSVWVVDPPEITFPEMVAVEVGTDDGAAPTATFVVTVRIGNAGPGAVANEVELSLRPGSWVQRRPISLQSGFFTTLTFEVDGITPGTYDLRVTVGDLEQAVGSVWVPTPARFELGDVTVSPNPMDVNTSRELTVVAAVSNLGEAAGSYSVPVLLDGELVELRDIDLAGGERFEDTFVITVGSPGSHELSVGDTTIPFRAYQLERPGNGTVLFNQIGGGSNRLRIVNNSGSDVLVVLTAPGEDQPGLLAVYVHAGSNSTVRSIRSGTYSHFYVFGSEWCSHLRAFTRDVSRGRFANDDVYTSTSSTYTQMDIEFGIIDGVGTPTHHVPEDAFPAW